MPSSLHEIYRRAAGTGLFQGTHARRSLFLSNNSLSARRVFRENRSGVAAQQPRRRSTINQPVADYVSPTPQGGWRITGTRVSLDSVAHACLEGRSPEAIAASLPALSLEQIHGAIAFYLHHREELDSYFDAQDVRWEELRKQSEAANAPLLNRIRSSRQVAPAKDVAD